MPQTALVAENARTVDHHEVEFLGTVSAGNVHTASWAVTELGCAAAGTATTAAGKGGGKGGTNCNSMSHIAFQDFAGPGRQLRANATDESPFANGDIYQTIIDAPGCGSVFVCLSTAYGHYQGASRPDGPGDWIKYSTINGQTVQLAKDFTHIFVVRFRCVLGPDQLIMAAVKSGNSVAKAQVPAPSCSA